MKFKTKAGYLAFAAILIPPAILLSEKFSPEISRFNPAGWAGEFYWSGWIHGETAAWVFLALSLGIIATLPSSFRAFRVLHHSGCFHRAAARQTGTVVLWPPSTSLPTANAIEARAQLLNSGFLYHAPWNDRGPVERALAAILSPNELQIARGLYLKPGAWLRRLFIFTFGLGSLGMANRFVKIDPSLAPSTIAIFLLLFLATAGCAVSLFIWPRDLTLVLFPVQKFHIWRMFTKLNAIVFALLFSLSLLAPRSMSSLIADDIPQPSLITPLSRSIELVAYLSLAGCLPLLLPSKRSSNAKVLTITIIVVSFFQLTFAVAFAGAILLAPVETDPIPFWFLDLLIPATAASGWFFHTWRLRKIREATSGRKRANQPHNA